MKLKQLVVAVCCATAAHQSASLALEEIVVTAQKRDQSLQDVPIAVSAISADQLTKGAVVTLSDISQNVPGLNISNTQSDDVGISMRGISSNDAGFAAEQSIPVYLDGAYMGIGLPLIGDLEDIAQVEVLKGPQGTLFGRNALGGAVSVTTADVNDEFEGKVSARLGNYGLQKLNTTLNVPLIEDELGVRINLGTLDRDGWMKNVSTGDRDGWEQDRWLARVKVKWTPSDDFDITWTSDKKKEKDHVGYYHLDETLFFPRALYNDAAFDITGDTASAGADSILAAASGSPGVSEGDPADHHLNRDIEGHSLKAIWYINDDLTLTSISSHRTLEMSYNDDSDGSEYLLTHILGDAESDEFSQEFRLNGKGESIDWFVGVSAFQQEVKGSNEVTFGSFVLPLFGLPSMPFSEVNPSEAEITSYGIFGDIIWSVTDELSLTWGARYSYDEKSNKIKTPVADTMGPGSGINLFFPHPGQLTDLDGNIDASLADVEDDWSNFSMRGVISYQFSDDVMVYLNVSQGYKAGGFNGNPIVDLDPSSSTFLLAGAGQLEPYDEETITAYELGIKSTFMDGRLRLNASTYFYDWKDLQVQAEKQGAIITSNVGAAEGKGVDVELTFQATEGLTLSANLGWMDTEVKDAEGSPDLVEGAELTASPSFSGSVAADYVIAVSDWGDLYAHIDYSYNADQLLTQSVEMESYALVNARIGFSDASDQWDVSLWSRNLTNEDYLTGQTDFSPIGWTSLKRNEPRTYGVEVSYRF